MRVRLAPLLGVIAFGVIVIELPTAEAVAARIREQTYNQLAKVHKLMEQGRYQQALSRLEKMRARVEHRPYEQALVLQTYGYLHTEQDQYRPAIEALTQCLALEALPQSATKRSLYLLAQLQMAVADHENAVVSLERWFALEDSPSPAAHALAGTAYAHTRRYREAIAHLNQAITIARVPDEAWYRQLLAVYYDSKRYRGAETLLQQMIKRFPDNKNHWLQLSSVYRVLGDESKSLAVMELAYRQGLLTREPELINLAKYYVHRGLPHKAGELLEKGMQSGSVSPTTDNWRLLVDAWIRARELDLALATAARALASTHDAELYFRRAALLAEKEQWADVVPAVDAALATETLQSPGKAHLLKGIAHYQLRRPELALASFERARDFDEARTQAQRWMRFVASTFDAIAEANSTPQL